jgi:type IV pilus assembly protein PilV
MILEVLVGILIFALGVLGIVGLQAASIKEAAAAEYRSMAALQANDIIGRMWASDRTFGTLQSNFASNSGTAYLDWLTSVKASGLPGVNAAPPTVSFTTVAGGGSSPISSSLAKVTVYWRAPSDSLVHNYVALAQLK